MGRRFFSKMVEDELKVLIPPSLAVDLCIFLASLPFYGFGAEVPLGLLLGTAAMTVNIILLGYASRNAVERTLKRAKRYMFFFYLLRMTILGAAITAGFKISFLNPAAVCLPMFYPKVIYTARAIMKKY